MIWRGLYFGVLLFVGCAQETSYLKPDAVQLSTPVLETSTIYSNGVNKLTAPNLDPEATLEVVHQSTGGRLTMASGASLDLELSGKYQIRSLRPPLQPSATIELQLLPEGQLISSLTWETQPEPEYFKGGSAVLTDGKSAGPSFQSAGWTGANRPFVVSVEMAYAKAIDSMVLGVLADAGAWIFPKAKMQLTATSDNGAPIQKEFMLELPWQTQGPSHHFISVPLGIQAQTFTLQFEPALLPEQHQGAGQPAWLFLDELIIY